MDDDWATPAPTTAISGPRVAQACARCRKQKLKASSRTLPRFLSGLRLTNSSFSVTQKNHAPCALEQLLTASLEAMFFHP
jgi:hypothetical protein